MLPTKGAAIAGEGLTRVASLLLLLNISVANLAKEFTVHCRDSLRILDPREQYPVRTTCPMEAPAPSSAAAIISRHRRACVAASPRTTVRPSGPSAAVPATEMVGPTRTAREMPTLFGARRGFRLR